MRNHLTPAVVEMIQDENWKGSELIVLESMVTRPSAHELSTNYVWAKPLAMASPSKAIVCQTLSCHTTCCTQVPSAYFLTDAFLMLDLIMFKKLFRPDVGNGESRLVLAGREGVKGKKLIQALRYLWRNSSESYDPKILDLKQCLMPSPARRGANAL